MRTCSLFALLLLLLTGMATAQTESNPPSFQISVYGGGTWYDMENFNDYMTYAKRLGLPSSPLYGGPNLGGEFDLFLNEKISVGLGVDYVWEDADAAFYALFGSGLKKIAADMEVSFMAPRMHLKLHNLQGPWNYHFGVGVAYIFGKAKLAIDTVGGSVMDLDLEENGVGAFGAAGASYTFAAPFTIGGQLGYRYYHAGELDDGELVLLYNALGMHKMLELDFSGIYAVASIGMKF